MAEIILKARVEVSGLGDDIDISARGTNTALVEVGTGYQTCGTVVVVISEMSSVLVSEVLGCFIQAESGVIYANPVCSVTTVVSAVGIGSAYCVISAPNFLVLSYAANSETYVTIRGTAAGAAFSYAAYGTGS